MKNYNIEEINKELWDICEDLKMQTNINKEYLNYISALLYVIYYRNDNLKMLKDLYATRKNYYIGEDIDLLIQSIRKEKTDLFYNVKFKEIKTYRNIGEENVLSKIIERLYSLIMKIQNKYNENKKYIAESYNYVITQAISNGNVIMRNGEVYTPTEIAKIMINCLNIKKENMQIADPYCGTGNILLNVPKGNAIFGKEENPMAYNICMTSLMLADNDNKYIELNNFEKTNNLNMKYDYILSNPPFIERSLKTKTIHNQKISSSYGGISLAPGDYAYVLSMLETLKSEGKMAVILPHGVLFRESEKKVREFLIKNNNIEAIIGMPANMFYGTRISVIIMILSKNKKDDNIIFIDASKEFSNKKKKNILEKNQQNKIINTYLEKKEILEYSHIANTKEIIQNDYDLTIKKYIKKIEKKEKIKKEEIIEKLDVLERERDILEENIKDVLERLGTTNIFKTYKKNIQISDVDYEEIGIKIKEQRKNMNYSLYQLSAKLEMSPLFLGRIEAGKTKVSLDTLVKICKELEISVGEILGEEVKKE